ncbi:MAG: DJ-1/PfpI family protein [Saprospiraceae bacterium]
MKALLTLIFAITQMFLFAQSDTYFCPPCGMDCDQIAFTEVGKCTHCNMDLVKRTATEQEQMLDRIENAKDINVAVYMQDGMEILYFAGPVEVFTYARMNVYTVGVTKEPIISQRVVKITPEYSIDDCPTPDIIVFLGGNGTNASKNENVLNWLKKHAPQTDHLFSVCTGAFFLGRAGLLDDLEATTFHTAIESLQEIAPKAKVHSDVRFVDNGKVITTAGISAGIDGSLHLVHQLFGIERAREVARYMEYDKWQPEEGLIVRK